MKEQKALYILIKKSMWLMHIIHFRKDVAEIQLPNNL